MATLITDFFPIYNALALELFISFHLDAQMTWKKDKEKEMIYSFSA